MLQPSPKKPVIKKTKWFGPFGLFGPFKEERFTEVAFFFSIWKKHGYRLYIFRSHVGHKPITNFERYDVPELFEYDF
jgi:hypothetical protein